MAFYTAIGVDWGGYTRRVVLTNDYRAEVVKSEAEMYLYGLGECK